MLPQKMIEFLNKPKQEIQICKIEKASILISIFHEIAHIKRRISINSPFYNTPRFYNYSLFRDDRNKGEIGYWLEEQICGFLIDTSSLTLKQAEIILSPENYNKQDLLKQVLLPYEKNLSVNIKNQDSAFKLKQNSIKEENKSIRCGCSAFGVIDLKTLRKSYDKI